MDCQKNPFRHYHGLDVLRAGLMLTVVFYHAGRVLSPYQSWLYNSPIHHSEMITRLTHLEYLFNMETFFLVSGFLSQMILRQKGKKYFLHSRWLRVAIPFLLGCLSINILAFLFLVQINIHQWEDFNISLAVGHGWFLITLFIFALLDFILPKNIFSRGQGWQIALLIAGCWLGYMTIHYFGPFLVSLLGDHLLWIFIFHSLKFYPFYLLGSWLFFQQERINHLRPQTLFIIAFLALIFASLRYCHEMKIYSLFEPFYQKSYLWGEAIFQANFILSGLCLSFLLFYFFYQIQQENSALVRYLMTSAIVIYLVHHPLIIIFAWLIDNFFSLSSNKIYFLLIVNLTFLASFALYEMIKRFRPLRFACGLKT